MRADLGGAQKSLPDGILAMFEASHLNGSLGWCVNLGSGASYFSGFLCTAAAKELLSDPKAVFAGSGEFGSAQKVKGGYEITGTWSKCTGSAHATAFTVNAKMESGETHSFVLQRSQVEILDEWELSGLEASSSYQIACLTAFVPEKYCFDIGVVNPETSYRIHEMDFEEFSLFCMCLSYLGIALCLVDTARKDSVLKERKLGALLNDFEDFIATAKQELMEMSYEFWERKGDSLKLKSTVQYTARKSYDFACELFFRGGLRMADLKAPVNQAYRDLLLGGQHFLLK